ncbi:hypothetical protein FUAX_49960 (plasmid) [Fulvitalea axinellae]|uniref:Uncharacterized protein n=1 Tax=Fulvitalea axinellae TaxID=1182444 RepID=A0AAU9D1Q0_9BACT|nr:hypothetical protein FUAX_49960 [Fulvitalea axinellae]
MMPQLNEWYKSAKREGWTLSAVSLDTDLGKLKNTADELAPDIPVYSDFEGWKGPAAVSYNVNATPALFVLDKNLTIIGKPNRLPNP